MTEILSLEAVMAALKQSAFLLAPFAVGVLLYGWLADRAIFEGRGLVRAQLLGKVDLQIAVLIAGFFLLLVAGSLHGSPGVAHANDETLPGPSDTIAGVLLSTCFFLGVVSVIWASLRVRGMRWWDVFGLNQAGPAAVLGKAALLIALAVPLIAAALQIGRYLVAAGGNEDDSSQEMVRFLAESPSALAKAVVAFSAVVLAPLQEEIIFRGYIYGVSKRYFGVSAGIIFNAALFAAIHMHAPSFAGLFVLAVCLTLAYEWTGSLFVPILMHGFFNAISVIQLLAGGSSG